MKNTILILTGPTASGKTAVSVKIAKMLDCEIISADSIQAYKTLDIGSAKPSAEEMDGVPHYLIGEIEVDNRDYSVASFKRMADGYISDIALRGKTPLIVGGTGLYINALTHPLNFAHVKPNETLRKELADIEKSEHGALHKMLSSVDPETASRLHANDTKRLIRALEVYNDTGKPISAFGNDFSNAKHAIGDYDPIMAGLTMPRELLYSRIEQRVDKMMESGLMNEVDHLITENYDESLPALQGLGYKQLIAAKNGVYSIDEAINRIKIETRHFAKRQITWFKRDKRIKWFDVVDYGTVDELAEVIVDYYRSELNERKNKYGE